MGGILDEGNVEFEDTTVYHSPNGTREITDHATTVAIIAAGRDSGIANESTIFAYGWETNSSDPLYETTFEMEQNIEEMITNGANVINCSWGRSYTDGTQGQYHDLDAYFDALVSNTLVTIVKSAGNNGTESDPYVTAPGNASNVITVGSTDFNGDNISSFSSISTETDIIKPTIVAPGGDIDLVSGGLFDFYSLGVPNAPRKWVPFHYNDYLVTGTSFAAPQVSGAIALMMEYKPSMIFKPLELMALLACGANQSINNTTVDSDSGLLLEAGAGLMDLKATFETMELMNSFGYYIDTSFTSTRTVKTVQAYFFAGDTIVISHAYMRNSLYSTSDDNSDIDNFDILLYRGATLVSSSSSTFSILELFAYLVPSDGYYSIVIKQRSEHDNNVAPDYGFVAIYSTDGNYFLDYQYPSC